MVLLNTDPYTLHTVALRSKDPLGKQSLDPGQSQNASESCFTIVLFNYIKNSTLIIFYTNSVNIILTLVGKNQLKGKDFYSGQQRAASSSSQVFFTEDFCGR